MRTPKLIAVLSFVLLQTFLWITPATSAAITRSDVIEVETLVTQYGSTQGLANALGVLDQTGSDNDPAKYILVSASDTPYLGYAVFHLPAEIQADKITSALVQVNFNGPPASVQTWTWYIHDWTANTWPKLGDSIGSEAGQWNTLIFRIWNITRYASPRGEIQIRLASDQRNNSARVDYEALHLTYAPVIPTATRPTSTLQLATKAGYTFPDTYTPSPTSTATNTPTVTNTPTRTSTPTATATLACAAHDNAFECQVLYLINQERISRSLPPLVSNLQLHNAARGHSTDMAQHNFFSHTGSDGSDPGDRITAAGYVFSTWGENIAAGYVTPADVVAGWMASQGHRDNILNPSFVDIGIGYSYNSASTYDHYWTTDFGAP